MKLYSFLKGLLSGLFKWIYNLKIVSEENVPKDGAYVVVCNHISLGDVIILGVACPRQIYFMAKKELFKIPLLSGLIKALGAFPVDRKGNPAGAVKTSIRYLKDGKIVGMFPQGTRSRNVSVEDTEFKTGAAFSAYKSGSGVIPAFIKTKNQKFKFFARTDIIFGTPISFDELKFTEGGRDELENATQIIKDAVFALEKEAYGGKYNA